MKVLLVAVNASFMHTNLAIRSISNYVKNKIEFLLEKKSLVLQTRELQTPEFKTLELKTLEFTINQPHAQMLRAIAFEKPDVVVFSTYIWNVSVIEKLIPDVKNLLGCLIGTGGPEVSYAAKKYFNKLNDLDFIIFGEGEETCFELFTKLLERDFSKSEKSKIEFDYKKYLDINGIYFFDKIQDKTIFTGKRDLICNLDDICFSYPELLTNNFESEHKIYYYESSRGCPYSCSYCLSSVDKNVRFKSLQKVFSEIKIFLDAKVKLVKFVDRTYNLNPERYIKIWQYILENHNQKTMFHFEIEAEFLSEEALEFLQNVPSGIMQFEIGVQSANKKTLQAICRSTNTDKLAKNISRIPKTIHQHLDLIAGLPFEDLTDFGKSYDFVMQLKPDALQLGFLKILSGTNMENFAKQNGWKWSSSAVYETFETPFLSFSDMMFLKDVEVLTDAFWNKHQFDFTINYILKNISPWKFIFALCNFAKERNAFDVARKDLYWFELFYNFINEFCKINFLELNENLLQNLLRYDFVRSGKKGSFPLWYKHFYDKEKHRKLLEKNGMLHSTRLAFALTEFEVFDFDVTKDEPQNYPGRFEILICYENNFF